MASCRLSGLFRGAFVALAAGGVLLAAASHPATGATAIRIGRTNAPDIAHLPLYVAKDAGLFAEEGLKASFVAMPERALVTAGLGNSIDFVPMAEAGARAALWGSAVRFVVGESLFPSAAIVAQHGITSVVQLKYGLLGLGQVGQAGYRDGVAVLRDKFALALDLDYRAVSLPDEKARFAALEAGDIQGGLFSFIYTAKAQARGYKRLFRTGTFLPRVSGTVWTRTGYLKSNRDTVRRFIRAVARAIEVIHIDGRTTTDVIRNYFKMSNPDETKALWHNVRDTYSADIPPRLINDLFVARYEHLMHKGIWPLGTTPPDAKKFIARDLLSGELRRLARDAQSFTVRTGTR